MDLRATFAGMPKGRIVTIAGVPYRTGVPAKEANVGWPIGVARRPDGDMMVVDWHCNRLWRVDSQGILHAFAGDGKPGNSGDGGPALTARFRGTHSISFDRHGNVFTADLANSTIRKIDALTGVVSRVAGSGRRGRGGDGGPALEAELDVACGVAVDADDNVYISGEWSNNIRKVDAKTGVIDLFAGNVARNYAVDAEGKMPSTGVGLEDWGAIWLGGYHGDGGPAKGAGFLHPEHLAFDSKGDMYVCDNSNNRVRKIDMTTGIITTVIGTGKPTSAGDGGPATQAGTLMPDAICLDAHDNLYLGEKYGYRVRKVDAKTGIVTTLVGNGVPGWGEEAILASKATVNSVEAGIYADPNGDVYWSDCSRRVRKYEARTGLVTTFLGGTSIHDGEVATNGFLCAPKGIAVGPDGQIYFADMFNQRVRGIDPATGIIRTVAGNGARAYGGDDGPATEAYLSNPTDVSVDSKGRLVIADSRHGLVRMVDEGGIMRGVAGTGFQWDKGDGGPARSANMLSVSAVAHGPNDDIYLCDGTSGRVRRIDARTGTIDTVAGTGRPGYSGDGGPARSAQIGWVSAIRFDGAGNMYLADTSNHAVRKVDAGGVISTVIGAGHAGFSPDGTRASEALLNSPSGLAVTKQGTMYVSDTRNNRVRKVGPDGRIVTVAGTGEPGDSGDGDDAARAELMEPHGLCLYGDDVLLVSDYFNSRVRAVRL